MFQSFPLHPAYVSRLLRRAAILWVLVRLLVLASGRVVDVAHVALPPAGTAIVLGALAFLAQVDARVMRETLFHANLGAPRFSPALVTLTLAATLELAVAATIRLVT